MLSVLSYTNCQKQWNSEEDIEHVVNDLNNNINSIETLQLSGNTLGVKAAEKLVGPISNQSKLSILLWNDLFTGRLKTEIGVALKSLSLGLMNAKVNLVELDLSDNAFGPNGVIGVTELLASPCCYTLKVLNMNNQGLGHQGCRYLVDALKTARINSNQKGMNLEVFIAGRNRLENAGMNMLKEVFGDGMNSLKKIVLLQNGIGVHGIDGVKDFILSIKNHSNLQILNISDNTIKPDGMKLICKILNDFAKLEEIYIGDCLIGNAGLNSLTKVMYDMSSNLKIISVSGNEITGKTAKNFILGLLETKHLIKSIDLTENEIKTSIECEIKDILRDHDKEYVWVEEDDDKDQYSDEDDDYDANSYDTESEDNSLDDYSEGDSNSKNESDVNTDETSQECLLQNLETTQNQRSTFYPNTSADAPLLFKNNNYKFGNENSSPSELYYVSAQSNLFNSKSENLSIFKTINSPNLDISSVSEKNENKSFSFLMAANISSINNNDDVNKLNQYIMDNLPSKSLMLVSNLSLSFNKKLDKSLLDSNIYQIAESNPENAVRLGLVLCDRFETFEIGTSIINFVLTSNKSWSRATNAFLVEMHCIKSEDKHFVPFFKEHSTLPFEILRNILDMESLLSSEVRLNLSTVLKNLYKVSYDEKDNVLRDLECCISNLNI